MPGATCLFSSVASIALGVLAGSTLTVTSSTTFPSCKKLTLSPRTVHRIPSGGVTADSTPSTRPETIIHSPCNRSKSFEAAAGDLSPGESNISVSNSACFEPMQKLRCEENVPCTGIRHADCDLGGNLRQQRPS